MFSLGDEVLSFHNLYQNIFNCVYEMESYERKHRGVDVRYEPGHNLACDKQGAYAHTYLILTGKFKSYPIILLIL